MKILYIECAMGAAGDMLLSALTELCNNPDEMLIRLNSLGIPGVVYTKSTSEKCGIYGTHIDVSVHGEHEHDNMHHNHNHHNHNHSGMHEITHIIEKLNASAWVKENALAVYNIIAAAEAHAHNCEINEIHFHEVGTMDAVADIVGVCMLMEELAPDKIYVSAVNTGSGTVKCAHGILPVPAPATAYILQGIPIYSGSIKSELCTPTGAALLKHFSKEFGQMPVMRLDKVGYGMGTKDFEMANCVRAMLGTAEESDKIAELRCNIDDMTGEDIAFATQQLLCKGAADVFTIPIGMKKNRPGIMLVCLCKESEQERFAELMFRHSSTIGIRTNICERYVLERKATELNTNYGKIRAKKFSGMGKCGIKPEHDDLERIARENEISISDIVIENTEDK